MHAKGNGRVFRSWRQQLQCLAYHQTVRFISLNLLISILKAAYLRKRMITVKIFHLLAIKQNPACLICDHIPVIYIILIPSRIVNIVCTLINRAFWQNFWQMFEIYSRTGDVKTSTHSSTSACTVHIISCMYGAGTSEYAIQYTKVMLKIKTNYTQANIIPEQNKEMYRKDRCKREP